MNGSDYQPHRKFTDIEGNLVSTGSVTATLRNFGETHGFPGSVMARKRSQIPHSASHYLHAPQEMPRPTVLVVEPEPHEALSVRKLVLETAKFNNYRLQHGR